MNIKELHTPNKPVSVSSLFKNNQCNVTAIQILKNGKLDEHTTKVPALLMCVEDEVVFENKNGVKLTLISGDYIDPNYNSLGYRNQRKSIIADKIGKKN